MNPNIALSYKNPEFTTPYQLEAGASELRKNDLVNAIAQKKMQQENALSNLWQQSGGDLDKVKQGLYQAGMGDQAIAIEQHQREIEKEKRISVKQDFELRAAKLSKINEVLATATPETWHRSKQELVALNDGIDDGSLPEQFDPALVQDATNKVIGAKGIIEQKAREQGIELEWAKFGNLQQHQNAMLEETKRGHDMQQSTFSYTTDPGGNVVARDIHDPTKSFNVGGQGGQGQQGQQGGQVNIFDSMSPKTAQLKQESDLKKAETATADLSGDELKKAGIVTAANNLADYMKNLDKYEKEVGGNPMVDNAMAYKSRAAMGTNDTVNNLESSGWSFVQDAIKAMKASGLSPTQMINTETEAERFKKAITGGGTAASMREAINRFSRAQKMDLIANEARRKQLSEQAGKPYTPLVDINSLPGPRIIQKATDGFKIGDIVETSKGKKVRIIAPGQVELVE